MKPLQQQSTGELLSTMRQHASRIAMAAQGFRGIGLAVCVEDSDNVAKDLGQATVSLSEHLNQMAQEMEQCLRWLKAAPGLQTVKEGME